ncbi:MAG TPA: RNA polymerase sigma factor, partial [Solirubrobacteraceae bacterium]|nr:RNA polymerase sigma factor [Solirubrobacteraceae bacterium]
LIRRGSTTAFEVLVSRYHARLLAFCRHLLGSREDAEDVLQEVFSAAFNAMLDDDRPINVRPWLYRIARNRSLNHLRRIQAVGVDSMDIHLFEHGATTADKVHEREEFRMLVGDIQGLPETQRTALVLREMDALSYEQIAEAMETTVPSVKSLLVRARVSLAEAAQARMLTCEDVRIELGEVAEGLRRRPGPLVRRHLRTCERCAMFKTQLGDTSKALAALLPIGFAPLALLRKLAIVHLGHSAGAGSSASGAGAAGQAAAVGSTAAAGATAMIGSTGGGFVSASVGAIATKAAAGLAAAALVTAGAVEVDQPARAPVHHHTATSSPVVASAPAPPIAATTTTPHETGGVSILTHPAPVKHPHKAAPAKKASTTAKKSPDKTTAKQTDPTTGKTNVKTKPKVPPGRTMTQTDATVLPQSTTPTVAAAGGAGADPTSATTTTSTPAPTPPVSAAPPSSDPSTTTTSTDPSTTTGPTTTATDPTSTDPGTTTPTTTSTTPAPAPSTDSGSTGSASTAQSETSAGVATYSLWRDRDWFLSSHRHARRAGAVGR